MEFAELRLKWDRTESRELLCLSRLPFTHTRKNESPPKKSIIKLFLTHFPLAIRQFAKDIEYAISQ